MKRLLKRIWDRLVILAEVMAVVFLLAAPAMAGEPLQLARMNPAMLVSADGPNTYYYSGGSDSYNANASMSNATTTCAPVTIVAGGSITTLGCKLAVGDSDDIKIALYDTSANRLDTGCIITDNLVVGWNDCSLATPYVASASTLAVCCHSSGSSTRYYQDDQNGYKDVETYANFPLETAQFGTDTNRLHAVRLYVD